MQWYQYPINVPYGNPGYDAGLGGSHDLDVKTPLGTQITALLSGTISDISSPSWGEQVGIKLDNPFNGVPYMSYLHLGAVNPSLHVGQHVNAGDFIGLSGGATVPETVNGVPLFVDSPYMSSGPQTGVAFMEGPVYGSGTGWDSITPALDPTSLIQGAASGTINTNCGNCSPVDRVRCMLLPNGGVNDPSCASCFCQNATAQVPVITGLSQGLGTLTNVNSFFSNLTNPDTLKRIGIVVLGGLIIIIAAWKLI